MKNKGSRAIKIKELLKRIVGTHGPVSYRQPMGQTRETGRWMARVARVALIVGALITPWLADQAMAQQAGGEAGESAFLFLGNDALPPMNFMKGGRPTGIVVDLAKALAERIHRPVEIRLMNWTEAQQLVLEGSADALLRINSDPERQKIYDFSEPLLTSESWPPEEVVFKTRDQLRQQALLIAAISVGLIVTLAGVAVLVREIRRRKHVEVVLRESEGRLRLFIEHAPASLAMFDLEMRYLSASHRWVSDYNLGDRDLSGVSHYEVFPEIPDYWKEVHRRGLAGEVVRADADRFCRADGSVQWVRWEVRPWRDAVGDVGGIVIFSEDITAGKLAEEMVRREKEEWEKTFNAVPDLIVILDCQHRVVCVNLAMAERLGLTPEQCIGARCHEVVHGAKEPPGFCPHALTCRDGQEHIVEVHEPRLGGYFLVSTTPKFDEQGQIIGSVHVARDITERKQMEEELRKSHALLELRVSERTAELSSTVARLELLNQELQEFAFVASHDLQEPLRKIQTFCDMAQNRCGPALDSARKGYLERVTSSASRMRQLLDNLLEFSRAATRTEPFKRIDLAKIVREAADVFEAPLGEAGGLVEIENMPATEADETQLFLLFQNLIGNALKFRREEPPRIKVYAKLDGQGNCEIAIRDNGIGFEKQYEELIFKPFQRLHKSREYGGTGMGLAICRKIAERHGGSIWAESEPGKGSTFIIRLPIKQVKCEGVQWQEKVNEQF